jgi:hypothetical protein
MAINGGHEVYFLRGGSPIQNGAKITLTGILLRWIEGG